MTAWTSEELTRIGTAEQLEIAALRRDGTLSSSRTIWVVPYGDGLYVRSVNGPDAGWYRGTRVRRQGHISVSENKQTKHKSVTPFTPQSAIINA